MALLLESQESLAAQDAPNPVVSATTKPQETESRSENPAPDVILPSLEGGQVTLSHFKGIKGVALVFFAPWCVGCIQEVPEIKKFAETAQKENVIVFGIAYKQPKRNIERFKKTYQIHYGILLDMDGTVTTQKFGIKGIPHIIGINAKGVIVYRGTALPDNKNDFILNLRQGL